MASLLHRLQALEKSIKIGIIGIGSIGKGIALQSQITPGINCLVIADIKLERAIACAEYLKREYQVVQTLDALHAAVRRGKLAVCEDGDLVARCALTEVVIEATGAIAAGGGFALTALQHGKHVVMMNYEADLLFGPYLSHLAQEQGVVYTSCDGDQPAVIKHLVDELEFMGFELVMAGNIKGYLDRYANPTSIIPEADKRKLDYKMCTSYTDGTKLGVEMAMLANGLGLRTAQPGMYGPRAREIHEVFSCFDFDRLWQDKQPVVDYVLGAQPGGGVFAIGYTAEPYQQDTLAWFPANMGPGPFYLFYRPYHLGHFEAMASVAAAALDGYAVLKPDFGFQTNVYAYAKRDLRQGERLDGIGGYCCYGLIENCGSNQADLGLPICLADEITLKRDICKDEKILMDDVAFNPGDFQFKLYAAAQEISSAGTGHKEQFVNEGLIYSPEPCVRSCIHGE